MKETTQLRNLMESIDTCGINESSEMDVFDVTYNAEAHSREEADRDAIDYALGMVWGEVETTPQSIGHKEHVAEVNGVHVWYDYAGDYYFFSEAF